VRYWLSRSAVEASRSFAADEPSALVPWLRVRRRSCGSPPRAG
jgi:integrase